MSSQLNKSAQLPSPPSPTQLDQLAENITDAVNTALTASTKRVLGQGPGQPWWDQTCRDAIRSYRRTSADPESEENEVEQARKDLRRTIRKAKRDYWREKINSVLERKDIFQIVGLGQSTGCFHSPAFVDPELGPTFARPKEKRDLLIHTLLQKAVCEEDVPIYIDTQQQPHLPFPPATPHEIQDSFYARKTRPWEWTEFRL